MSRKRHVTGSLLTSANALPYRQEVLVPNGVCELNVFLFDRAAPLLFLPFLLGSSILPFLVFLIFKSDEGPPATHALVSEDGEARCSILLCHLDGAML